MGEKVVCERLYGVCVCVCVCDRILRVCLSFGVAAYSPF